MAGLVISMPDFSRQFATFFPGPQIAPVGIPDPTFSSSALASRSKIRPRVSIIGNYRAVVMACTGPAAGPRFKEIKKILTLQFENQQPKPTPATNLSFRMYSLLSESPDLCFHGISWFFLGYTP